MSNFLGRIGDAAPADANTVELQAAAASVTILGSAGNDFLTGGPGNEQIYGLGGNDTLTGGAGADLLDGGEGSDLASYAASSAGVNVSLARVGAQSGGDAQGDTLASIQHLAGSAHADTLTGNGSANTITGGGGDDALDGGGAGDKMRGGAGNDQYAVDHAGDIVEEASNDGVDTVSSSIHYTLPVDVENLTLIGTAALRGTGNAQANLIVGNDGANQLNGAGGADTMRGGAGNDVYFVDQIGDSVVELDGQGIDTVSSALTYTLGAAVENLVLTGTQAINATGNSLGNQLTGNGAANQLSGGGGQDIMRGGLGDDAYVVDDAGDQAIELADQGVDRVTSSVSHTLGENVENLFLTGTAAINGTGNAMANGIVGNSGANVLDGRAGADVMQGGAGNDVYFVDQAGDQVIEANGGGIDTINAAVSFSLAGQYAENLNLTGADAINGIGNGRVNKIVGNSGANVLDGAGGKDVLRGGAGSDSFAFTVQPGVANIVRIEDFVAGEDRFLLAGSAGQPFQALASGALGAHAFRTGAAAADADDRIIYNRATGALWYDADGTGGVAAVQLAVVKSGLTLTAADFFVTGPANRMPVFSSGTSASIAENSPTSTVVYQASATDPNGDTLTYSLAGADAGRFTIDASGAVRLIQAADYESQSSYALTVKARDSGPWIASRDVTVTVTDVADSVPPARVNETTQANDRYDQAQFVGNALRVGTPNPTVPDVTLPTVTILGNATSPSDKDFYSITLGAGELLILDVDESGGNLDSFVEIYGPNSSSQPLVSNDDPGTIDPGSEPHPEYGHNTDSLLRFRAPEAGTYRFSIQAFQDATAPTLGSYQLHVSVGPPASPAERLAEDVAAMLSGQSWPGLSLSYGFPTRGGDYQQGEWTGEIAAGMAVLTSLQQSAVRSVLIQAANLTNLAFSQAGSPGSADLRYALSSLPETAYAAFPGSGVGGDSWYSRTDYASPLAGNYDWAGFLHETGHALGLKHPHEDAPTVSIGHDMLAFTVMSYRSYEGAPIDEEGGYTNETWSYPQTYMILDIAALQSLYGADFGYNSGDTRYSWNPDTGAFMINGSVQWIPGANRVFMAIWDGGGTDTYDLSNYGGATIIDLRPGEWVRTSAHQFANLGDGSAPPGNVANALLYQGDKRSLIENVIGGSGNDAIVANEAVNRMTGNGGQNGFHWNDVADSPLGAADTITDYHLDFLDFSGIDAIEGTPANDSFTLIGANAFTGTAGQLRWTATGDRLDFYADVDGDAVADLHVIALWDDESAPWIPDHLFIL